MIMRTFQKANQQSTYLCVHETGTKQVFYQKRTWFTFKGIFQGLSITIACCQQPQAIISTRPPVFINTQGMRLQ